MKTLEIIFTGIVYLLGSANDQGGKVTAILPAVTAPVAPFGTIVPEHTPYLKVKRAQVTNPDQLTPTIRYRDPDADPTDTNPDILVFRLGETRSVDMITIVSSSMTLPEKLTICKTDPCPKTTRLQYDKFVAHREEICPKCGPIDEAFKKSDLSDLVAARLVIEHGHLSAAKPPGPSTAKWTKWHIKPPHGVALPIKEQRLAEMVALDLESLQSFSIVVTATDENNSTVLRHRIELISGASVEIGNMPLAEIVLPAIKHDEPVDHHFGLFYTMLEQPVPAIPPVPTKPPHATLGPSDNCPPLADEQGG